MSVFRPYTRGEVELYNPEAGTWSTLAEHGDEEQLEAFTNVAPAALDVPVLVASRPTHYRSMLCEYRERSNKTSCESTKTI